MKVLSWKIMSDSYSQKQKNILFNTWHEKKYRLNFPGEHQQINAQLAYSSIEQLKTQFSYKITNTKKHIMRAFWPGRIQKIHKTPDIIFDVAHNAQSINAFTQYFQSAYKQYDITYLIIGFEQTKEVQNSVRLLSQYFKQIILTETKTHKSMLVKDLLQITATKNKNIKIIIKPKEAIQKVRRLMQRRK